MVFFPVESWPAWRMKALAPLVASLCLGLAACADSMDHDDGRWLVTSHDGETDYEMGDAVLRELK